MAVPGQPAPPFLYGNTVGEKEESRKATSFRLDWNAVAGATEYDVRFGASDIRSLALRGQTFGGLLPNSLQSVRLRARNLDGNSPWSDPFDTEFTRPESPGPAALTADARRESS